MSNVITIFAIVPVNTTKENAMYIHESEVPTILAKVSGAEFFHMTYIKKDGSLREATAQLHVSHPRNESLTPNGLGESAKEALQGGRIKYYEPHHSELKGEGVYRQCAISRLVSIKVRGVTYKVIH